MLKMNFNKYFILLAIFFLISFTSCFDEYDEEYDIIGAVATIPIFVVAETDPAPGETVTINLRYYSENVAVRQIRIVEVVGTSAEKVVITKDITDHKLEDSYEEAFFYNVPAVTPPADVTLKVEIETVNDLVNSKSLTLSFE